MAYEYWRERKALFLPEGQKRLVKAVEVISEWFDNNAGRYIEMEYLMTYRFLGSAWDCLAVVDYLVELRYLQEVSDPGCMAQHRRFIKGRM